MAERRNREFWNLQQIAAANGRKLEEMLNMMGPQMKVLEIQGKMMEAMMERLEPHVGNGGRQNTKEVAPRAAMVSPGRTTAVVPAVDEMATR